jgi:alcohol dehydrogenase
MKAAVIEALNKPMVVHANWPEPRPAARDALVRVEANGICRSDWHLWSGDWSWIGLTLSLPTVIGHEFCGVVEEVGAEVTRFKPGDRVVVPFNFSCGACDSCVTGHQNVCRSVGFAGAPYSGGYGRLAHVPLADMNLVGLPESIPFVEAASMGCRFMTSFHGIVDQAEVKPGEWVAVHGCGGIGLAAIHIATALGARVVGVDIDEKKLALAKDLGAAHVVNAAKDSAPAAVQQLTGGGAHVSIDALGEAITCQNSIMSLRLRGRHLQIGLTSRKEQGQVALPIDVIVLNELRVIGTVGMQPHRYAAMLSMVAAGQLRLGKLIGRTVPIEQAGEVLASMTQYATLGTTVVDRW